MGHKTETANKKIRLHAFQILIFNRQQGAVSE